MPAKGNVSIRWQIVFAIISTVNLWAFYRIKKLRKYVMYVMIPSAILVFALSLVGYYEMTLIDPSGGQMGSDAIIPFPTIHDSNQATCGRVSYNSVQHDQCRDFDWIDYAFSLHGCKMVKTVE